LHKSGGIARLAGSLYQGCRLLVYRGTSGDFRGQGLVLARNPEKAKQIDARHAVIWTEDSGTLSRDGSDYVQWDIDSDGTKATTTIPTDVLPGLTLTIENVTSPGATITWTLEQGPSASGPWDTVESDTLSSSTRSDVYTDLVERDHVRLKVDNDEAKVWLVQRSTATGDLGNVKVTDVVPGTGATNLGKSEDAAAGDGDTGVALLAKREDTPSSDTDADGDYSFIKVDSKGRPWSGFEQAEGDGNLPDRVAVVGGDDGTDVQILQLDANGNLKQVEQDAPVAEDNTNGLLATLGRSNRVTVDGGDTSTDSWALVDDGNESAQISAVLNASGTAETHFGTLVAQAKNTGSSGNDLNFRLQGRYNDGSVTGDWLDVEQRDDVSDGDTVLLRDSNGDYDEYRVQFQASSSGSQSTATAFMTAKPGHAPDESKQPEGLVGEQTISGVGNGDVNPSSNGVTRGTCDIYVRNLDTSVTAFFQRKGASTGIEVPTESNISLTNVTSTDGFHEIDSNGGGNVDVELVYIERV